MEPDKFLDELKGKQMTPTIHPLAKSAELVSDIVQNKNFAKEYAEEWSQDASVLKTNKGMVKIWADINSINFYYQNAVGDDFPNLPVTIPYTRKSNEFTALCHLAKENLFNLQKSVERMKGQTANKV